ncbi:MAG: DUF6597 domain-containing transcriptional factor, partial [Dongiaceae bacterium]
MHYRYQQFRPVDAFRHLIDAYWLNQPGAGDGASSASHGRVLPDGCIDLVFRGYAGTGIDREGRLFSSALIERPMLIDATDTGWFVGIRFRPAMAQAILDIEPSACRDRDIRASEIDPGFSALEDRLRDCHSPEQALTVLKRKVDERLANSERRTAPGRVREALALLARGGGDSVHVGDVALSLGIAERSLHRELVRWTGLAPKSMARILRMQRTMTAIRAGRMPLAAVAHRMGYAD